MCEEGDAETDIAAHDFVATEEEDEGIRYPQTHKFYQPPLSMQRMQFTNSASVASVSSMSPTTTPPPPSQPTLSPPPQPLTTTLQQLKKQQHHQQQRQVSAKTTAMTAQPLSSAAAVTFYQQQQQQQQQPYKPHLLQQHPRPEQMTSATDVSANFKVNVNLGAAASAAAKRQQQKLRRLRELHSLALEGGDTARGYCSCDEQWTSSSPTTSASPTLSCNEGHDEKTSEGSESNEPSKNATSTTTTMLGETSVIMTAERVATGSAYKQMNVTTGHGRLAVGGNDGGHSRTRQQTNIHNKSSSSNSKGSIDVGVGNIWTGTRANEVAKAAAAVVAAKAAEAVAAASTAAKATSSAEGKLRDGRSKPVPAVRLKQQHHVRFSDEKNFSD